MSKKSSTFASEIRNKMSNPLNQNEMEKENLISNGVHYLSGIGETTKSVGFCEDGEETEVRLFCIDNVTYGAYIDPDDGYRSYSHIEKVADGNICEYKFPPQKVEVENVKEDRQGGEPWDYVDRRFIVIKDAILKKDVLVVGTDYSDDYYPCAIFDYQPMNLYANVEMQAKGFVS